MYGWRARSFPRPDRVQALLDVAAGYLEARPSEPADDHTVVMVHVNAEVLAAFPRERPTRPKTFRGNA